MSRDERILSKVIQMAKFADQWAEFSPSKQRKVGCVIFDPWCREVLAFGYNGLGSGLDDTNCHIDTERSSGEVHSEINSLLKLDTVRAPYRGAIMYVGTRPCVPCAGAIINSRCVGLVLMGRDDAPDFGRKNLEQVGIHTIQLNIDIRAGLLATQVDRLKGAWK